YDGSSALAEQIIGGAPVDVFASADEPNMKKVTDEDLAEGEPIAFATSELVIAVAPGNPLKIESLADLTKKDDKGKTPVTVICAPEVPCGNAAHTLLDRDKVDLKPASEEQNVTAVLTKVREGEADAGLVYRSDVLRSEGEAEAVTIENASDAAGLYLIAPLKDSKSPEAAKAFSEYMLSDEAQQLFEKLGFAKAPGA
ncbi:MAG: molybdate ABC transporter substrate-binding protein, partial [Leucobacter sp.]